MCRGESRETRTLCCVARPRCIWFKLWADNVHEAHRRGQRLIVFYFRGHLRKHGADWSSWPSKAHVKGELNWEGLADAGRAGSLWDAASGLGASQRGEVAYLKKCSIPFLRVDVADGAPGASELVDRLAARGDELVVAMSDVAKELEGRNFPGARAYVRACFACLSACACAPLRQCPASWAWALTHGCYPCPGRLRDNAWTAV